MQDPLPGCETPALSSERPSWQHSLSRAIRDPADLLRRLGLPVDFGGLNLAAARGFPILVPLSFANRMRHSDPCDPLLRQVLPIADELLTIPGFVIDPVGDTGSRAVPGLLQKYRGRALMIATGVCAVHCRYCFRRHYPYATEPRRLEDWEPAFELLQADESIHEVLLSGGDPLMLGDVRLGELFERLANIPHLRRIRVHTRLPIVLPDRITPALIDVFTRTRLTPILVVHANHPNEIVDDCEQALRNLVRSGITTLNQTVLLRGINDNFEALTELSERLIDVGVIPYYLHQLDQVQGAAHFEVAESKGLELIAELRKRLPGYAVPQYVREVAGALHKTPIGNDIPINPDAAYSGSESSPV